MELETYFHVKLYLCHFLIFGYLIMLSSCFLNLVFLFFEWEVYLCWRWIMIKHLPVEVPVNCLQAPPREEHPIFGSRSSSPWSTTDYFSVNWL